MTPANKGQRFASEVLTPDEFKRLLAQIVGNSPTALRNRALILTIQRGGLRVSEGSDLKPTDIDLKRGTLKVREAKYNRKRTVGLDAPAVKALEEWMAARDKLGWPKSAYLFGSIYSRKGAKGGGRLHTSYLRRLLPQLAREAKINKRVHPHILRHTRAYELASEGVPVNVIQKALGHKSLATTSEYLDHVAADDVVSAMTGKTKRGGKA
jgi:integrase